MVTRNQLRNADRISFVYDGDNRRRYFKVKEVIDDYAVCVNVRPFDNVGTPCSYGQVKRFKLSKMNNLRVIRGFSKNG